MTVTLPLVEEVGEPVVQVGELPLEQAEARPLEPVAEEDR
jgi:hypothetical protein